MGKKKTFQVGEVYVETGQVYIGDPMYVVPEEDEREGQPSWQEFITRIRDGKHKADGELPNIGSEPYGKGQGIVLPSGLGDGIYPVYVTMADNGTPEAAYIYFGRP